MPPRHTEEAPAPLEKEVIADTPPASPISIASTETAALPSAKACLFVAGLPASVSSNLLAQKLREIFEVYGPLHEVKVLNDRPGGPYSFVHFENVADAATVLADRNRPLCMGRALRVEKAYVNRTLFLARFPTTLTVEELTAAIEAHAPVESVTICKHVETQRSKGCGFVKFANRPHANQAYQGLRNSYPTWVVEWCAPARDKEAANANPYMVFVGGLDPAYVTKEMLKERFAPYGTVASADVISKGSGNRSAFGFVRYESESSSELAIDAQNGTEWFGRRIRVQYCETDEAKMRRKEMASQQFIPISEVPMSPPPIYRMMHSPRSMPPPIYMEPTSPHAYVYYSYPPPMMAAPPAVYYANDVLYAAPPSPRGMGMAPMQY